MLVLVSYDVSLTTSDGRKRLRHLAKCCLNFGQRVQCSVFECNIDYAQFLQLKNQILDIINPKTDSIRFYLLGNHYKTKVEHYGIKETPDLSTDTLIL